MVEKLNVEISPLVKILGDYTPLLAKEDLSTEYSSDFFRTIDYDCDDGNSCDCDNICDISGIGYD